jgi:hypothetical protein
MLQISFLLEKTTILLPQTDRWFGAEAWAISTKRLGSRD